MTMHDHYNDGFDARLEGRDKLYNPWSPQWSQAEYLQWERGWLDAEAMLRLMGDKRTDRRGPNSNHHR